MAHQFTIQKVADRARQSGMASPITAMPLWFIEGVAEYYAQGGLDPETDLYARDLLANPSPERGYAVPAFFEDRPGDFIQTYKMGQARVAFLAAEFGEKVVQAVLDQSPRLAGAAGYAGGQMPAGGPIPGGSMGRETFVDLVARLCGADAAALDARWKTWMKRRYFKGYLEATQDLPEIRLVDLKVEPDAYAVATDGKRMLLRAVERETGRARLMLVHRDYPDYANEVAIDGRPGVESLHPVARRVMALSEDQIAFFAQDSRSDVLYVQKHTFKSQGNAAEFTLGERRRYDFSAQGLVEAGDPTFSPDGKRLAFMGLDEAGKEDIYVFTLPAAGEAAPSLRRYGDDAYSERDLRWGEKGIYFASDRSAKGHYNLYLLDPETGTRRALTQAFADQRHPHPLADGRVVFTSSAGGKPDLWIYEPSSDEVKRITDFVTGVAQAAPGPESLHALGFYGGKFRVLEVPATAQLDLDRGPARGAEAAQPPLAFAEEPIPGDSPPYRPFAFSNWRVEGGGLAIAGSPGASTAAAGVVGGGSLLLADVMRDRNAYVNFAIYGDFALTDALVFYLDRTHRLAWGAGLFHSFEYRRDPVFAGQGNCFRQIPGAPIPCALFYLQRQYGLAGLLSYPFDSFSRADLELVVQGVTRKLSFAVDNEGLAYSPESVSTTTVAEWERQSGGTEPEIAATMAWGYDSTRLRYPEGVFGGSSLLLELGGGWLPLRGETYGYAQGDAQHHVSIVGRSVLSFRAAAGAATTSRFGRQFFVYGPFNLRGFPLGDPRLLGSFYYVGNAELNVPLDALIRVAFFQSIEGIMAVDFGGVADAIGDLWGRRTLAFVLGGNLTLGPFEFLIHFAQPIDIGGLLPASTWVPNISIRYAYF
jgi:hypothetical protein